MAIEYNQEFEQNVVNLRSNYLHPLNYVANVNCSYLEPPTLGVFQYI